MYSLYLCAKCGTWFVATTDRTVEHCGEPARWIKNLEEWEAKELQDLYAMREEEKKSKEKRLGDYIVDAAVANALEQRDRGIAPVQPTVDADTIHNICLKQGIPPEIVDSFNSYVQTPEGKLEFAKTLRFKLWKAGFRPHGWEA